MSKLYAKLALLIGLAAVLVACGGQPVKPEEAEREGAADAQAAKVATEKVATEEAEKAALEKTTEAAAEPEPVVEVMASQKETAEIAVEPIPAVEDDKAAASADSQEEVAPEAGKMAKEPVAGTMEHSEMPMMAEQAKMPSEPAQAKLAMTEAPKPKAVEKVIPTSSGPTHFVVTVGPKQPSHPAYGKGHNLGFIVDGISGKELVVERGKTYTFDIVTDPKHDVYLSKKAVGWGGAPYAKGVEGAYTYKGKMTLKATKDTPDTLYYACRNHPYMGGVIHVVDPGQKVDIKQQSAAAKAAGGSVATKASTVSQAKVKQKLMFAEMMAGAKGAKRVMASDNREAKDLVLAAKKKLAQGREKSMVGALPEALALANESLKMLSEATRLVPGDEELAQMAESYKAMRSEIKDYQKSYRDNLKRMEKAGSVPDDVRMDEKALAAKLDKAEALAQKKNYVHANKLLQEAQGTLTGALHKMLDSKTIVYDLKFDSAKDEYEYELKRFTGYEELIPVAIEAKKPAPGAIKLMESFLSKARSRRDEAIAKAEAGDYPTAIAMLLQATKTVRRALRMVGVSQ